MYTHHVASGAISGLSVNITVRLHILSCSTLHCTSIAFRWRRRSIADQEKQEDDDDNEPHTHLLTMVSEAAGVFHGSKNESCGVYSHCVGVQ